MRIIASMLVALSLIVGLAACSEDNGGKESSPNAAEEQPIDEDAGNQPIDPSADPDEPVSSDNSTGGETDIPAKKRPATKEDTIGLEGNDETFQFTLHDDPALGFSTYIVEDFLAEGASSGEGDTFVVYANFAGTKNEDAMVSFFSPSAGTETTVDQQAKLAQEQLEKDGFEVVQRNDDAPNRYAWSEIEFGISKQKADNHYVLGTVSIFKHGDRVYRVIVQYPEDWEEGFGPRASKMFEDIMWYDEK